jgi:hypothetical protein
VLEQSRGLRILLRLVQRAFLPVTGTDSLMGLRRRRCGNGRVDPAGAADSRPGGPRGALQAA